VEALKEVDAEILEQSDFLFGTDPFGHGRQMEMFRKIDQRANEDLILSGGSKTADKAAVNFDDVDAEHLQIAEGGEPGAEIVNGDLAPHFTQV
jgi:hypothetical protein